MSAEPQCPFPNGQIDRAAMPERIKALPVLRGFPVPWFVAKVDGEYDFRVMDPAKLRDAVKYGLCWVCGERLGRHKAFVIGPMCGINHTSAEPPSHVDCARFSARHCPFLSRPKMKRREDELTRDAATRVAGRMLSRNPGACGVWHVVQYETFGDGRGGRLFDVGEPMAVEWYAEGRAATRAEVEASIASGIHLLEEQCDTEPTPRQVAAARAELVTRRKALERWLPE